MYLAVTKTSTSDPHQGLWVCWAIPGGGEGGSSFVQKGPPRCGDKAGWTDGQSATAHNGPDALHLPTKEGVAPASRLTGSPEIASAQPESHPSCPTKTGTKAMSAAASPTRSMGARAFLCQAPQAQA